MLSPDGKERAHALDSRDRFRNRRRRDPRASLLFRRADSCRPAQLAAPLGDPTGRARHGMDCVPGRSVARRANRLASRQRSPRDSSRRLRVDAMVTVETPRLVLRPPEANDAAPLMAIHQDPDVAKYVLI